MGAVPCKTVLKNDIRSLRRVKEGNRTCGCQKCKPLREATTKMCCPWLPPLEPLKCHFLVCNVGRKEELRMSEIKIIIELTIPGVRTPN